MKNVKVGALRIVAAPRRCVNPRGNRKMPAVKGAPLSFMLKGVMLCPP